MSDVFSLRIHIPRHRRGERGMHKFGFRKTEVNVGPGQCLLDCLFRAKGCYVTFASKFHVHLQERERERVSFKKYSEHCYFVDSSITAIL
jgi:hypothetical protein